MATPVYRWNPTTSRLLALAAFILFLLAILAFNGTITGWDGHTILAIGLCCLAASGVFA